MHGCIKPHYIVLNFMIPFGNTGEPFYSHWFSSLNPKRYWLFYSLPNQISPLKRSPHPSFCSKPSPPAHRSPAAAGELCRWYQAVFQRLQRGDRILDVGIGTASALVKNKEEILERRLSVVGIDYEVRVFSCFLRCFFKKIFLGVFPRKAKIFKVNVFDCLVSWVNEQSNRLEKPRSRFHLHCTMHFKKQKTFSFLGKCTRKVVSYRWWSKWSK